MLMTNTNINCSTFITGTYLEFFLPLLCTLHVGVLNVPGFLKTLFVSNIVSQ